MNPESQMRGVVVDALRALHAVSVENAVDAGTPDVNFAGGWIELKQLPTWPWRDETPVRVPKFTEVQRMWLRRRCESGGSAWLLLRVDHDWLLFWGRWAAEHLGTHTRTGLFDGALAVWPGGLDRAGLVRALTRPT